MAVGANNCRNRLRGADPNLRCRGVLSRLAIVFRDIGFRYLRGGARSMVG